MQKPGVDNTLVADLNFLTVATKLLEFFNPSLSRMSLANIVSDIKDSMFDELDFVKESANLVNFREFLSRNGITDAVAPMPYLKLCTKRVLTMEYLKGIDLCMNLYRLVYNSRLFIVIFDLYSFPFIYRCSSG